MQVTPTSSANPWMAPSPWGRSAVGRPRASAFGTDAYPALDDKAAALLHSLARNHALADGNQRLALAAGGRGRHHPRRTRHPARPAGDDATGSAQRPAQDWTRVTTPQDLVALLKSRRYLALLLLAATVGVPVSAAAYGFLGLVSRLQRWFFTSLPGELGFHGEPAWWPAPLLAIAGLLVGLTIKYLPGRGGHSPADGFHAG